MHRNSDSSHAAAALIDGRSKVRWLLVVAALCFACQLHAQPTESAGVRSALNWRRLAGADACPGIGELARRISVHLKHDPFVSPASASVVIDASIEKIASGFDVRIALSSNGAEAG